MLIAVRLSTLVHFIVTYTPNYVDESIITAFNNLFYNSSQDKNN